MFQRFKKWIGVNQVKIKFNTLPVYPSSVETLNGELIFYAQDEQEIESFTLVLSEVYTRGRGENKRIDEYTLGEETINESILLSPKQPHRYLFKLPFQFNMSNMDKIGKKNLITRQISRLAKSMKGVQSDFSLQIEAKIRGQQTLSRAKTSISFK